MIGEGLRERIAQALGWTVEETKSVSLMSLRELLRPCGEPKLVSALDEEIRSDNYVVGERRKAKCS